MNQRAEAVLPGLRVRLWRHDMDERCPAQAIKSPGATKCFMRMNDEKILPLFILCP
ncbi:hypothetical protein ACVWY3_003348 [Bradyrhizobium sp. USDA 4486]